MRIPFDYPLLLILTLILTVGSCGRPSVIDVDRIDRAASLIDVRPDSALVLLDSIDDSRHDNREAYIRYLIGKCNLNMLNYPEAMRAFLKAEKLAVEDCDDSVLILSRRGLMDLSDSIYDINAKARHAIALCEVYYRNKDFDNMYEVLSEFEYQNDVNVYINDFGKELEQMASRFRDNDTVMEFHSYSDSAALRGERLYQNICNSIRLNSSPDYIHIDGIKQFDPENLIEKIISDDGWHTEIVNDSVDIDPTRAHLITTELWKLGHPYLARDFMLYYRQHYCDKIINQRMDADGLTAYVAFRINDTRKREFRSTFQNDVKETATQVQYEEVLTRENTIHTQRIILVIILAFSIMVITAICMYTRAVIASRRMREEQNMLSAAELRSSLHGLEEENLTILSRLCDTYYENYTKESDKSRTARETFRTIRSMASSDNFITRLGKYLDRTSDGVMTMLDAELPNIKESDRKLFLYNAIGLSIPSMCLMMGERREVIYNRRVRLRTKISESEAPHKDIFLKYLQ
ncbi:MAG: hypothetical protein HDS01_08825 [Bacteroides sp.]|nr:hypothetical protein [Bacteroides sp.]